MVYYETQWQHTWQEYTPPPRNKGVKNSRKQKHYPSLSLSTWLRLPFCSETCNIVKAHGMKNSTLRRAYFVQDSLGFSLAAAVAAGLGGDRRVHLRLGASRGRGRRGLAAQGRHLLRHKSIGVRPACRGGSLLVALSGNRGCRRSCAPSARWGARGSRGSATPGGLGYVPPPK